MTVMSNSYIKQSATFSEEEIGAAKNAFLQYEKEQQVHLLAIMPVDEAVAILAHCRRGFILPLIQQLKLQGHDERAELFSRRLRLTRAAKPASAVQERVMPASKQNKVMTHSGSRLLTWLTLFGALAGSGVYYMLSHTPL